MKKQSGITLIALIITIIVLLILAGVSINLVVGQNGVVGKAQNAVGATRLATLKEELELWNANNVINKYAPGNTETLAEVLDRLVSVGTITELEKTTMLNGGNNNGVIVIDGEEFSIIEYLKDKGSKEQLTRYLVNEVEIGDYVDIGIEYTNTTGFTTSEYVSTTSALTGWRVLSKSGTGATGTVKLVSAGCPLTYFHTTGDSTSIQNLENLYKELDIVTEGTGFRASHLKLNGVETNNLQDVFTEDKYIDTTKGIHALSCSTHRTDQSGTTATAYTPLNEFEEAYKAVTAQTEIKTMAELYATNKAVGIAVLQQTANSNWKESYTDLLDNGQTYWLGGASSCTDGLWRIGTGSVSYNYGYELGVRPVISLQSGVEIDTTNTGDGTTSTSAYKITK